MYRLHLSEKFLKLGHNFGANCHYRPHTEYDGKGMFLLCVSVHRGRPPRSRSGPPGQGPGGPQGKVWSRSGGPPGQGPGGPQVKVRGPPRSRSGGPPGQGLGPPGQGLGGPWVKVWVKVQVKVWGPSRSRSRGPQVKVWGPLQVKVQKGGGACGTPLVVTQEDFLVRR